MKVCPSVCNLWTYPVMTFFPSPKGVTKLPKAGQYKRRRPVRQPDQPGSAQRPLPGVKTHPAGATSAAHNFLLVLDHFSTSSIYGPFFFFLLLKTAQGLVHWWQNTSCIGCLSGAFNWISPLGLCYFWASFQRTKSRVLNIPTLNTEQKC